MDNKQIKLQQKQFAKFLKKCGVKKTDTQAEIDNKILAYVKYLDKNKIHTLVLDEAHQNDPEFLILLYLIAPETTFWFSPKTQELLSNKQFMLSYFRVARKYQVIKPEPGYPKQKELLLVWVLREYPTLFKDPEFVQMLAEEFPEYNMIYVIKECYEDTFYEYDFERKHYYEKYINSLPKEFITTQVKKFGKNALELLPQEVKQLLATDNKSNTVLRKPCEKCISTSTDTEITK